jgi:hypothetical protein
MVNHGKSKFDGLTWSNIIFRSYQNHHFGACFPRRRSALPKAPHEPGVQPDHGGPTEEGAHCQGHVVHIARAQGCPLLGRPLVGGTCLKVSKTTRFVMVYAGNEVVKDWQGG